MPLRPDRSATGAVGRRAVVTGLAGASVLALAGCAGGSPDNDLPGTSEAQQDADLELVRSALGVCAEAIDQLEAVSSTSGPAAVVAPLIAVHRAHAAALRDAVPGTSPTPAPSTPAVPTPPAAARTAALRVERHAHDRLVALAQRAQSGALARLLASMAAGISQRLVALR